MKLTTEDQQWIVAVVERILNDFYHQAKFEEMEHRLLMKLRGDTLAAIREEAPEVVRREAGRILRNEIARRVDVQLQVLDQ